MAPALFLGNFLSDISDDRYGTGKIINHDKKESKILNQIAVSDLENILSLEEYKTFDIILIDELQFFKDAFDIIIKIVEEHNKTVVCSGLDGDINRETYRNRV